MVLKSFYKLSAFMILLSLVGCIKTKEKNELYGSGTLETNEINVSAKVIGKISYLAISEGQSVTKGQIIAKLDDLAKAEKDYVRAQKLFSENIIPAEQIEQAQQLKDNYVLTSPITGIVILQELFEGETATPGMPIVTLADTKTLWVKIYIPEDKIGKVKLGSKAKVYIDTFPDKNFGGTVINISDKAEFIPKNIQTKEDRITQVFAVKVAVENPENQLKIGMPADVYIEQ
ncbi:MAG: efflux RND transporter periplasmic adaptor subunit [Elusimicrobia bacterium]|nr:efflux RND transporter periplasmic adaptor subunit [Elusimicrobiota bacterium]